MPSESDNTLRLYAMNILFLTLGIIVILGFLLLMTLAYRINPEIKFKYIERESYDAVAKAARLYRTGAINRETLQKIAADRYSLIIKNEFMKEIIQINKSKKNHDSKYALLLIAWYRYLEEESKLLKRKAKKPSYGAYSHQQVSPRQIKHLNELLENCGYSLKEEKKLVHEYASNKIREIIDKPTE